MFCKLSETDSSVVLLHTCIWSWKYSIEVRRGSMEWEWFGGDVIPPPMLSTSYKNLKLLLAQPCMKTLYQVHSSELKKVMQNLLTDVRVNGCHWNFDSVGHLMKMYWPGRALNPFLDILSSITRDGWLTTYKKHTKYGEKKEKNIRRKNWLTYRITDPCKEWLAEY